MSNWGQTWRLRVLTTYTDSTVQNDHVYRYWLQGLSAAGPGVPSATGGAGCDGHAGGTGGGDHGQRGYRHQYDAAVKLGAGR